MLICQGVKLALGLEGGGGVAELELTECVIYDTVHIKVFKLIYVMLLT